ncbi:MAG TPA: C2H2-type zinc finger protein, partial [Gammaproteobacteria bacterium]|nr:C2H2-type zinc finger protein [Gammaproteobacteria bacterium]
MSDPDATWISHSIDELEYDFINDKSKDIRWDFDTSISVACAGTAFVLQNRLRMLEESLGLSTKIKEEKPILSKDEKQIASTPVLMPLDEFAHIPLSLSKETQDNISQVFSFMPTNLQSHTIASNHPITNSTTIPFSQPETKSVITFSPLIDEIQNPNTFSLPGVMVNPYFQATPAIPLDMAFAPNMNAIMPAIQLDRILPAVEKEKETKLDAHIRYTCTFPGCNKSFLKNFTLKRHSKLHTEEPNKICDCCGKYFRQNSDLKRHMNTKHSLEIFPGAESKKFSCVFTGCNKKFKYPQSLARHNKFHAEGCKEICDCCGKAFFEKSSLKRHKNRLTPCTPQMKFSCTFTGCEETYPHKSFLLEHSKCHQEGIGQKADGAQEEKILGLNNLPRAKKRKEMATNNKQGKNKLPCSFSGCDKEFSGKDTLSRHMKLHTEKPGHLCDCCGKGFYNAYSLSLHKKRKTPCTQKLKVLNSPHSFFGKNSSSENNNENNHIQI